MTKYVLSVDGGGIRGIIPAVILAEIEKRAEKPISQIFDLMAGTSSGGIVCAGLCQKNEEGNPKYTAEDLVELYERYGNMIFEPSFWKSITSWINDSLYPYKNIEFVLDTYFGETVITDIKPHLMLTSYDIHNNCPYFFKSWKNDKVKLKEALRASTAAPTYFTPKRLRINEIERVLVDGGVFANNPAACAYANTKTLFPNDNIVLLSIGTGRTMKSIGYDAVSRFGKLDWVQPLLHVMFTSSLDIVNYQLHQIMGNNYKRIQLELSEESAELDNATKKNVEFLKKEAKIIIDQNQELIDEFCTMIRK